MSTLPAAPLVQARGLTKLYEVQHGVFSRERSLLSAVEDVDLTIARGETLGLVGESGSGKSTIARLLLRLIEPTRGDVVFDGQNVLQLRRSELRRIRRRAQIVFQDPFSSLNPRHSVKTIVGEGIPEDESGDRTARVLELLELVGLPGGVSGRYPHEFSGGQRQRIAIARALAVRPEFLVLDEPVSALDVSVQSKILNLLTDLKKQLSLTYLFISHDLSVVKHVSDRVAVMYLGHIVETGSKHSLYANPRHPYAQSLLSAVPSVGPREGNGRVHLGGEIPSPIDIPKRCRFATRCPRVLDRCRDEVPVLELVEAGHAVACFNHGPIEPRGKESG